MTRAGFETLPEREQFAIVLAVVGRHFGFTPAELRSTRRRDRLTCARRSAIYLAARLLPIGRAYLGSLFNGDHVTVACACRAIDERRHVQPAFAAELAALRVEILATA